MIAADMFRRIAPSRRVWLFDTFEGMTKPSALDVRQIDGRPAVVDVPDRGSNEAMCHASIEDVRDHFNRRRLLLPTIKFVVGDVLATLAETRNLPDRISVLRLDTDWYESTKFELEVLYPRLQAGGVLIIDDYGYWRGAREAVDQYFSGKVRPFLQYVDETGRAGVKPR